MKVAWALAAIPIVLVDALSISTTGHCGKKVGLTCKDSTFGNCCSQYNYCGSAKEYCGTGCQSGYGDCTSSGTSSVTPVASSTPKISQDGSCGGDKGYTCLGSSFGDCCSQYGYCGAKKAYCGTGCNPLFGTCSSSAASSSVRASTSASTSVESSSIAASAAPSTTLVVSTNARCGNAYEASPQGMTCSGSKYGNCCSQYSYCGSTDAYCGTGCQPLFGSGCNSVSSSSSRIPTTSSPSSVRFSSSSSSEATTSSSSSMSSEAQSSSASTVPEPVTSTLSIDASSFVTITSSADITPTASSSIEASSITSISSSDSTTDSPSTTSACTPAPSSTLLCGYPGVVKAGIKVSSLRGSITFELCAYYMALIPSSQAFLWDPTTTDIYAQCNYISTSVADGVDYDSSVSGRWYDKGCDTSGGFNAAIVSSTVSSTVECSALSTTFASSSETLSSSTSSDLIISTMPTSTVITMDSTTLTFSASGTTISLVSSTSEILSTSTSSDMTPSSLSASSTTSSLPSASSSTTACTPYPSAIQVAVPNVDGDCGPAHAGETCIGSTVGSCCSASGTCGSDAISCGMGCQPLYGNCDGYCGNNVLLPPVSSSSVAITTTATDSTSTGSSTPSATACANAAGNTCGGINFQGSTCCPDGYSCLRATIGVLPVLGQYTCQQNSASSSASSTDLSTSTSQLISSSTDSSSVVTSTTAASTLESSTIPESTSVPTPSTFSTVVSSSSSSSSSEPSSSAPSCAPVPASTNYVVNPSFESYTGTIQSTDAWEITSVGATTQVYAFSEMAHTGNNGLVADNPASNPAAVVTLSQTVTLPAGYTFKVGLWYKNFRSLPTVTDPYTAELSIDGVVAASLSIVAAGYFTWVEFVAPSDKYITTTTQGQHTIQLSVNQQGPNVNLFAVDDFYVTPVANLDGLPLCSAA